ncbi:MAG: radical SAM protein, partial [Acidobacteriota bacterium]
MIEPAGLYLHIPFCSAVCPYCDFAVRRGDTDAADAFADVLRREIDGVASGRLEPEADQLADAVAELAAGRFDSIYLGGGTPSLLGDAALGSILDTLRRRFRLTDDARICFEANPEDLTPERARSWRRLGVHMLSLGIQALDGAALSALGRHHGVRDAAKAVDVARDAGFDTVSIDLIYGLPGQDEGNWTRQLDRALELPVDHISL